MTTIPANCFTFLVAACKVDRLGSEPGDRVELPPGRVQPAVPTSRSSLPPVRKPPPLLHPPPSTASTTSTHTHSPTNPTSSLAIVAISVAYAALLAYNRNYERALAAELAAQPRPPTVNSYSAVATDESGKVGV